MNSTAEIMDVGMHYLVEKLGTIDAERFVSTLIREKADYTKWRQQYFADMGFEEFHEAAVAFGKEHTLVKGN